MTEIEGGWDYAVFEINGAWIVRVPRRPEVRAWLRKEARLLPEITPLLPLPVPRFRLEDDGAHPFVAYRRLAGDALDETLRAEVDAAAIGEHLGAFLAELHRFPVERASGLTSSGPTAGGWIDDQRAFWELTRQRVSPLLTAAECDRTAEVFDTFFRTAERDIRPALVHGDLGPDHILCSRDRVTGVIDWSDACVGDPAIDLSWVLNATPAALADALVAAYGSDASTERARFYFRIEHLHEVLHGMENDDPALVERALRTFRERLP